MCDAVMIISILHVCYAVQPDLQIHEMITDSLEQLELKFDLLLEEEK